MQPSIFLHLYYQVTAVVLLLGWITTFMFFSGLSKHVYVFSMVLKDIIVKDVISSFMAVFVITVIAFSSALYVLRGPVDHTTAHNSYEINAYEVFASGLTMAEYIKYTIDEHGQHRFFRSDIRPISFLVEIRGQFFKQVRTYYRPRSGTVDSAA